MKQEIKQLLAKFWLVFTWKGLKAQDRLKLWGTEICAFVLLATIENMLCLLALIATVAMWRWTDNTVDKNAMDDILNKLEDDNYGK